MTPADVTAAAALDRELFSAESWSEADFFASLQDPTRAFFVACDNGILCGFCGLQQSFEQGDVLNIGVSPAFRRQGIGSMLMNALVEEFCKRGGRTLFLEVRAGNLAARTLYERFGFCRVGVRRNYYQQPTEDGLVYSLEVDV